MKDSTWRLAKRLRIVLSGFIRATKPRRCVLRPELRQLANYDDLATEYRGRDRRLFCWRPSRFRIRGNGGEASGRLHRANASHGSTSCAHPRLGPDWSALKYGRAIARAFRVACAAVPLYIAVQLAGAVGGSVAAHLSSRSELKLSQQFGRRRAALRRFVLRSGSLR